MRRGSRCYAIVLVAVIRASRIYLVSSRTLNKNASGLMWLRRWQTYLNEFSEPWQTCNNCKQPYQNQLSIDLASAFVSFAEAIFGQEANSKWDKMKAAKVMTALRSKILTMSRVLSNEDHSEIEMQFTDNTIEIVKVETTVLINNLLSMVAQIKKDLKYEQLGSHASSKWWIPVL